MTRELRASGLLPLAVVLVMTSAGRAQTVRPLIDELGNPGKGRVEYVNDGLTPLNVILEAKSFTVSERGEISYRPLDSNIHLRLSTTSFRIQPKQTYYVFYEASSEPSPAWFVIYAAFSGFAFRTAQGMNVRLELPHTVYLLPKQSLDKSELQVSRAQVDAKENKAVIEVENTGPHFGRVLATELLYAHAKQAAPGFPVFPHSKRTLEVPLEEKPQPNPGPLEVLLELKDFKLQQKFDHPDSALATVENGSPAQGTGTGSNP